MIKLQHLDKYFFKNKRNEIHVMNDISLDFPEKGLVILLGPSGSGKTTLLNVVGGLDKVNKGSINFNGQYMDKYDANTWDEIRNEKVGYIFQNYNLLPNLSVFDNVAFVLRLLGIHDEEVITKNVEYILKAVGMFKYRKKKATQLSGGQQQRVAIARALVKNPQIVIADEPTGNLDSKNTLDIMKIIKSISREKLVVLVTHEKDIAKIYGDHIIELKDGKIVNQYVNESQFDHEHIDENIVYLKDMHHVLDHQDEQFKIEMYQEEEKVEAPVQVKLVVRNKTLYIDVDSSFKQVKLIDERSNLVFKNEHYKKMEKQDFLETTFDENELVLDHVKKDKKILVSSKQIIKLAFQKVLQSTKKGKLLLISFIFSGMMIALAMALAANFIVPNPSYMKYDNDYVIVNQSDAENFTIPSYDAFKNALGENDFINQMNQGSFSIVDEQTNSTFFNFSAAVDLSSNLDNPKMVEGSVASASNEIMISSELADSFFESGLLDFDPTFAQSYGIWTQEDLLKEKIVNNQKIYEIAGIVKSDLAVIYVPEDTYYDMLEVDINVQRTDNNQIKGISVNVLYREFEASDLLYGSLPTDEEALVTSRFLDDYGLVNLLDANQTWPVDVEGVGSVSGVIENADKAILYVSKAELEEKIYDNLTNYYFQTMYVHTDDAKTLISQLKELDLEAYKETSYALSQARNTVSISFMVPMIIIIFGASFLGFYFLMHSTMISRIYEISVYRSLGMKKREIAISYLVETAFMSTITSMIGYLIATFIFMQFSSTPLGDSPFMVSPLSVLIGALLVYIVNIGAGMIPILTLLRNTPSEISAKYDI